MIPFYSSRRTLVAVAALAASSASFAQATYSFFGNLDLGAGSITRDVSNTNGAVTTHTVSNQAGGVPSSNATNALGIRGSVDVPGGMTAGGVLAWSTSPGNVANNGTLSGTNNGSPFSQVREGNVYLSGSWGKVVLGSQLTPFFYWASQASTLQDTNIGGSFTSTVNTDAVGRGALAMLSNSAVRSSNTQTTGAYLSVLDGVTGIQPRYENAVTYATPNLNGFIGTVTYIGTDSGTTSSGTANADSNLNGLLLRVDYDKAPLSVHFARHGITQESLTAKRELATTFISADYNFGPAAGWATFTNSENKNLIGAGAITTNTYEIGVRVPMGQWTPFAFIGNGTLDNTGAFTSQAAGGTVGTPAVATTIGVGSVTASAYQIGVKYSLVKNATLWAGYGQSKFENSAKGDTDTVNGLRVGMTYGF